MFKTELYFESPTHKWFLVPEFDKEIKKQKLTKHYRVFKVENKSDGSLNFVIVGEKQRIVWDGTNWEAAIVQIQALSCLKNGKVLLG